MSQFFKIHEENPQQRLIFRLVEIVNQGGVIVYPTDSTYAIGCRIGNKIAKQRIQRIRALDPNHKFTVICPNLSSVATYAKVDNIAYRLLRRLTPGPYTFILPATSEVPRLLVDPRRKTIGLRVPSNPIAQALLSELEDPLMSVTLSFPNRENHLTDPSDIRLELANRVDAVVDGGYCGTSQTTVIDLVEKVPRVVRAGKGDVTLFEV